MASEKDSKTEKPTPRRMQKAREKGQIARSREVPSAVILLGMLLVLSYFGNNLLSALEADMRQLLQFKVPREVTVSYLAGLLGPTLMVLATTVVPLLLVATVLGLGANLAQGGLAVSWNSLAFHFEKMSPKNGLSRVFSKNGVVELLKNIFTLTIVAIISYQVAFGYIELYPRLLLMDARRILYWTAVISYEVLFRVAIAMLVMSLFDYAFQKYRLMEQLKMTKQEVKEEYKDTEGDPTTRGRIRRIQREMARKRMMADVPEADVVVTNPTHYAVALSYKMEKMEAPKVVAKGVGFLALRIKELAQEHDIPLVENKLLAQTLYKTVEVGESIPASLYKAVAEILAYVYKARNAWRIQK